MSGQTTAPQLLPDESAKLQKLLLNVGALREHDWKHRRPDVDNDLWDLDDLSQLSGGWDFQNPTFVPHVWKNQRKQICQREYDNMLRELSYEAIDFAKNEHIVIAGGAAAWPLFADQHLDDSRPEDIDFFVFGVHPDDRDKLWSIARKFITRFGGCRVCLAPGVITLSGHGIRYQLILRAYETKSAIIHGFDLPASAILFDGETTYMSAMGVFAHLNMLNVVDPRKRSPSYEYRLAKYFARGYGLVLPGLDMSALTTGVSNQLPHLTIRVINKGGNFAAGILAVNEETSSSDYEPSDMLSDDESVGKTSLKSSIVCNIANGRTPVLYWSYNQRSDGHNDRLSTLDENEMCRIFAPDGPLVESVISAREVQAFLDRFTSAIVTNHQTIGATVRCVSLKTNLGMTTDEAQAFASKTAALVAKYGAENVSIARAVQPHHDRVKQNYQNVLAEKWWVTSDPQAQFTSSKQPCSETDEDWYGRFYDHDRIAVDADFIASESDRAMHNPPKKRPEPVFDDGTCAICLGDVQSGGANTATLSCGHVYHLMSFPGCAGIIGNHNKCPKCRRSTHPHTAGLVEFRTSRAQPVQRVELDMTPEQNSSSATQDRYEDDSPIIMGPDDGDARDW